MRFFPVYRDINITLAGRLWFLLEGKKKMFLSFVFLQCERIQLNKIMGNRSRKLELLVLSHLQTLRVKAALKIALCGSNHLNHVKLLSLLQSVSPLQVCCPWLNICSHLFQVTSSTVLFKIRFTTYMSVSLHREQLFSICLVLMDPHQLIAGDRLVVSCSYCFTVIGCGLFLLISPSKPINAVK